MNTPRSTRPRRHPLRLAAAAVASLGPAPLGAAELHVPGEHGDSIQAAIDAAEAGDVVVVAPGTYRERLRLTGRVTVRSAGGDERGDLGLARAEATVLDGAEAGNGPGVSLGEGAVLDGFTITRVGRYDEAEWERHHASRGEEQAEGDIAAGGTPAIAVEGVSGVVRNNIVHHNGHRHPPAVAPAPALRESGGGNWG